ACRRACRSRLPATRTVARSAALVIRPWCPRVSATATPTVTSWRRVVISSSRAGSAARFCPCASACRRRSSSSMSQPETRQWPDLAGRMLPDGAGRRRHVLPVRVYFEDTDFSGLVYHGSYIRWCERGRSDFLRLVGNDHRALIEGSAGREPSAFVVRRMQLEYLRPARIDEVLEVTTRVKDTTAATLTLDQRISRDGRELFSAEVMVVLVSRSG